MDIIVRTPTTLSQTFLSLEKEALRTGMKIHENKTKYTPCIKSCFSTNSHFKIEEYNFEVVNSFSYLGSEINNRNDCTTEIKKRITMANRCLNGLRKYRKSNLIKRKPEVLLYKSLLRSVLTYAWETWSMSRADENMMRIYERKILRAMRSLVVRAWDSDRKAWVRCPTPPNTLHVHTEYVLVKQWVRKSCGWSQQKPRVQGAGEYFPPLQFPAYYGGGDRWCRHLS
ncbi:uncharacterized protein TNCV_1879481 [Trichonephila clavipes]|nr:uncharacterized protein TNCV_1879481 [Trichonephila clavipes]